jgi:ubiquinone/menaquinone biosynthesis C-methylase UbiE
MEVFEWIDKELTPRMCNSEEFFYDDMESQSGDCLPIIYQEFDLGKRGHWCDRGALFDFLLATRGEGRRLLDFGPGDGWPSLIVAPFAEEVIGVDGSRRRIDVCRKNAKRLGISNAEFVHVEVGSPLPFEDATFDGIMAASSIEQTPDPQTTLSEIRRVLKPGGRVRISYEDLDRYGDGKEREVNIERLSSDTSRIVFYDRRIAEEYALMYSIVVSVPAETVLKDLGFDPGARAPDAISVEQLKRIIPHTVEARRCRLSHPSGKTLASWLEGTGFGGVIPSHSGIKFAGQLFEQLREEERPADLPGLDRLLRPLVEIVVGMPAPVESNPPITAMK